MELFYKHLSLEEKAFFDDGIDAPCPMKGRVATTKQIYFYKFLDQYLCYRSGPRAISLKAGKSANILGGVGLEGTVAKEHMGGWGARPQQEIGAILRHLGLYDYFELYVENGGKSYYAQSHPDPSFVVLKFNKNSLDSFKYIPPFREKTYSMMCCSITIGNTKGNSKTQHMFHAITGFMCDDKGYLFDSNQRKMFRCDWQDITEVQKVVNRDIAPIYSFFKNGQIDFFGYNYVIFSNNSYVENINPVCRLKRKEGPSLNAIIRNSTNKANALQKFKNLESAGYKMNMAEFSRKLGERFPGASPKKTESFEDVKREMSSKKYKYELKAIYSRVWRQFTKDQRLTLMHYINMGVWKNVHRNLPLPQPLPVANSPRTARRKNIVSKFNNYWTKLTKENRNVVRNYITKRASPKVPSPRPSPKSPALITLKTAKARAEWLKRKRATLTKNELANSKALIKQMNQFNRNRRAAKKKT